jgi:magnesium-transporting ATPase (P-type)
VANDECSTAGESAAVGESEATASFGLTGAAGLAGLSSGEAKARLAELDPNLLVERQRSARFAQWLRMLVDPMALMLAGAAALYMLLGQPPEAVVLAAVIVPVLGLDVLMEARSRSALKKLASTVALRARVFRDGRPVEISTAELCRAICCSCARATSCNPMESCGAPRIATSTNRN